MLSLVVVSCVLHTHTRPPALSAPVRTLATAASAHLAPAPCHPETPHPPRLVKSISAQLHPRASPSEHALRALAVALYPTHFFFAFLYYTDVAALASALLVLLLVIQARARLFAMGDETSPSLPPRRLGG